MKRLLLLFTMLFCFSIAGICKTTATDLGKNSKVEKELVSYSDVVKVDSYVSTYLKAVVGNASILQVPTLLKDASYYTTSNFDHYAVKFKTGVSICIRDKIRIV